MDDLRYGTRNKRGDWSPTAPVTYPPVFVAPPQPVAFAKWLFGYPGFILGWNLPVLGIAAASWWWLTPSISTMRQLSVGWITWILLRNLALVLVWFGGAHWWLYIRKAQGNRFKFNGRWLATGTDFFRFRNQTKDNVFWALVSGVPQWTAFEVVTMWMFANGHIPWLTWARHPVWFVALFLLVPILRDVHFYAIHRLIHVPWLYRHVHHLHHTNTNVGPWSGLAMHPVEHLAYFSGVLLHWLIPSHPAHAMYHVFHAGLMPMPGHTGFERIEVGGFAVQTHSYAHYLHHKYFEVNYADGVIPLDKWFGSFHDGSTAADEQMQRRLAARTAHPPAG